MGVAAGKERANLTLFLTLCAATADFSISSSCIGKVDTVKYYTDSDCSGSMPYTARSHTGVLIMCNGAPVHWRSKKQPITCISSAAAEIYAMAKAARDSQLNAWKGCTL